MFEQGFYRVFNGESHFAPHFVWSPDYQLHADDEDKSNLPEGWVWCESLDQVPEGFQFPKEEDLDAIS